MESRKTKPLTKLKVQFSLQQPPSHPFSNSYWRRSLFLEKSLKRFQKNKLHSNRFTYETFHSLPAHFFKFYAQDNSLYFSQKFIKKKSSIIEICTQIMMMMITPNSLAKTRTPTLGLDVPTGLSFVRDVGFEQQEETWMVVWGSTPQQGERGLGISPVLSRQIWWEL